MIVSFAWTTPALLAGHKTMTRREWTASHAARFKAGMLVDAWDRSPRTGKGHKIATIRLTEDPRRVPSTELPTEDYRREGFTWLQDHGYDAQVEEVLRSWVTKPRYLWLVQFEVMTTRYEAKSGGRE